MCAPAGRGQIQHQRLGGPQLRLRFRLGDRSRCQSAGKRFQRPYLCAVTQAVDLGFSEQAVPLCSGEANWQRAVAEVIQDVAEEGPIPVDAPLALCVPGQGDPAVLSAEDLGEEGRPIPTQRLARGGEDVAAHVEMYYLGESTVVVGIIADQGRLNEL
eukprot:CAMPEP_0180679076 /NCGR_PEP_ID=MMETSP1037_2-20121125/68730_1 /TAXON_ID=632150 /ORGANISM="Azadinium spinosum, Strain 3D9" /LENGTH=157 /DNA_ID=CAMNT_0022708777 /DNA_START=273 /DNA_END=744 /DNA_ORIENTATION=+